MWISMKIRFQISKTWMMKPIESKLSSKSKLKNNITLVAIKKINKNFKIGMFYRNYCCLNVKTWKRVHSCNCNKCMKKFKYFSIYKTNYYSGFREADFFGFLLFFHTQMFLSLHQFATKNQKPTTMFLFCCCYRNS